MSQQLALDLRLRDSYTYDNFIGGDNGLALDLLRQAASGAGEPQVLLWGEQGTGKSHLLQASCQAAAAQGLTSAYLPLDQVMAHPPELLQGMEKLDLVALDDLQLLAGQDDWQHALFDFINRIREQQHRLIFATRWPPNELTLGLEDLRSRLNWGPVIQLRSLADADKQKALQQRARSRGFELPDAVAGFMLNNYARDLNGLFDKLEQLDQASLAAQRRLTIPFVKSVCES